MHRSWSPKQSSRPRPSSPQATTPPTFSSPVADDFRSLLPKREAILSEPYDGPLYWLWTFDPQDGKVVITHNEDRHRAHAVTHQELAPEVTHPERLNGYAYKIRDGYRITTDEHRPVEDPFILKQVLTALKQENPKPLPHLNPAHVATYAWSFARFHYGRPMLKRES